ncbi:LysR family transcriptional regulator [Methylophilus sp.]|uniref:LysR family transcriptional regulator n=1 Tax=Methylophilus sp. TaxID=29541 RepID=UPI004036FCB7
MNLRDLKYLLAVSEYKNFTKAADYCATTQPTLSNQIRKLENFLDVEIFERSTHFVRVTPIGQRIIDAAKRVVENSNLIVQIAHNSNRIEPSKLKFGSFPSLGNFIPLQYVAILKQQFEQLKIQYLEDDVDALVDLLTRQEIDFALLPFPEMHPLLEGVKLFDDPFYVAVPIDHAYASSTNLQLSDLANQQLLFLIEDQSHFRELLNQFDTSFSLSHQAHEDDFRALNFESLRIMVKQGLGLAIIPGTVVNWDDSEVRYVPLGSPAISWPIGIYWSKQHAKPELLEEICTVLQSNLDTKTDIR